MAHVADQLTTDRYAIWNGDCIEVMQSLPDNSIHGSIYSPPFGGLYHYSSDERDLSNARSYAEFFEHYEYVIREKYRLTIPGRTSGVHAALVPTGNSGSDAYTDFPGDVIRAHQRAGWLFVARHVIWKEPLAVRNRTMQKNLAHKTIVVDGAQGGVASPDELLVFRKPGGSDPVTHPRGLTSVYAGGEQHPAETPAVPRMGRGPEGQPVLALAVATLRLLRVGRRADRPCFAVPGQPRRGRREARASVATGRHRPVPRPTNSAR